MLLLVCLSVCWEAFVKCYEKAVQQSGRQLKEVSPVKDASYFLRQRLGKEKMDAKAVIEAMPLDVAQYLALNLIVEFGFPVDVAVATSIAQRMEHVS